MKLKDQVCSLSLAKKLKKLGVKQESLFYWVTGRKNESSDLRNKGTIEFAGEIKDLNDIRSRKYRGLLATEKSGFGLFSAFTVAELGEMLPQNAKSKKLNNIWYCGLDITASSYKYPVKAKTEANTRAKMLIYLLENKLIND